MKKILTDEVDKLKYRAYKIADLYHISDYLNFATLLNYSKYKNSYHGDIHIYGLLNIIHDLSMEEINYKEKYVNTDKIVGLLIGAVFHDLGYSNPTDDEKNIKISMNFWNYASKSNKYLVADIINGSKYPFTNNLKLHNAENKDIVLTFRCIDHSMFLLDPTLYGFLVASLYKNEWEYSLDKSSEIREKFLSYWNNMEDIHNLVPIVSKKREEFDVEDFIRNYLNDGYLSMYWNMSLNLY